LSPAAQLGDWRSKFDVENRVRHCDRLIGRGAIPLFERDFFITLSAAYTWVAENAEGPSDDTRAELLQLVDQSDFAAFWDLLTQSTDDNGYAIQSHTLELQPDFSLI